MLSRESLQSALDLFDLGELIDVRPTTSGLFGQNVFVTMSSGEWVLRGAPHFPGQFSRDRHFADELQRHTQTPVPWPYLVEEAEDLFGWSYALMPRLPGTSPAELRGGVGRTDLDEIARALGAGLAELHRLTAPEPGDYDPEIGAIRPLGVSFGESVIQTLEDLRTQMLEIPDALDRADLAFIQEVVDETRHALAEDFQPCCVHLDYKEGNVLVDHGDSGWRVTGVFDLMTCAYGDGEQDLPRMTASLAHRDKGLGRSFIAAYREVHPFRRHHCERLRLYMLIDRMILWSYGRRNRLWFPDNAVFREFAGGSLALLSILDD